MPGKAAMGKSGKLGGGKSGRGKKGKKLGNGGGISGKIGGLEHKKKGAKSSSMLYFTVAIAAVLGIVFVVKMVGSDDKPQLPAAPM